MKKYEMAEMETVLFAAEDVIATSNKVTISVNENGGIVLPDDED